jgi:transcriptional regulator with XRE-family HTH domain
VSRAIRAGTHPIAAWRAYRDLSQVQLAEMVNLTQGAIARIERAGGDAGKPATRRAIAEALDAPLWAIEQGAIGAGGIL